MANSPARKLADLLNDTQSSGYLVKTDGSGVLSWEAPLDVAPTGGTVDLTNGGANNLTEVDITSIPAGANFITITVFDASSNGASEMIVQLGTSGGLKTSGYLCWGSTHGNAAEEYTTGFGVPDPTFVAATDTTNWSFSMWRIHGNVWGFRGNEFTDGDSNSSSAFGYVDLGGELDRFRLTHLNGTDAWDAGSAMQYGYKK